MTQHAFQTEVQQLLHLMIHSLYSEREIFLRELISNASDACDKLRFLALTDSALMRGDENLRVEVLPQAEEKRLVITDNGIGMTEAEAIEHLGTIAKSGTKAFLKALGDDQKSNANLIGQFGVGFYSAFMVADRIVVETRAASVGADHGVRWESTGDGNFSTETITRAQRGTTVTLHLKDDAKDFLEGWRLRELIKKYSDYVAYPVRLPKHLTDEEKKKGTTAELEQVNAGQALWTRPKDGITDAQYLEFYKSACKQWDEPATRLHFSVEGTLSFTALLFIPGQKPMDLFDRQSRGLGLYVKRVFVMDDCKDLLPEYLRFVRGVVDSDDLPLNVSREILQQQDTVAKLRKQLVKRILDHLLKLGSSNDEAEKKAFVSVDGNFGAVLREGLVGDFENRDRLSRLARYRSTHTVATSESDRTGLEDYVRRMPEGQKSIYFITAPSLDAAKSSPHLEGFKKKGFEVLFMTDQVDEWVAQHLNEFDKRPLVSVAKGVDDLADDKDKKALEEQTKTYSDFLGFCKEALADEVSEVRLSNRLTDSPCCLVGEEHALTPQMEELMRRMGQDVPKQKRILEVNAEHPLVVKMQALQASGGDQERLKDYVRVMRDQAVLAEGGRIADPAAFARRVQSLLSGAVDAPPQSAKAGA
ncbi:MAG: molecular chaperone HtpG [Planctomycetes bacterium]|nr:molecular chaperone HtpG [Planctomycetota bacterium]